MIRLEDYDPLYKSTISQLPAEQSLWYCTRQLDKLQMMLMNNSNLLDTQLKENLRKMIEATQAEISRLERLKQK